jgi:hypothetical protein
MGTTLLLFSYYSAIICDGYEFQTVKKNVLDTRYNHCNI